MQRCHPKTCDMNPDNGSRIIHTHFSSCPSSCADCPWFLTKRPFLGHPYRTSTPQEFKAKLFALAKAG